MVFQIVYQINVQELNFPGNINQGGDSEVAVQPEETDCIKRCNTDKTFIVHDSYARTDPGDQHGEQYQLAGQVFQQGKGNTADFDTAYKLVHKNGDIGDFLIDLAAAGEFEFQLLQGFICCGRHMFRFPD